MATVLGLAMKVTADTSGFTQSLDPVDRALQGIQKQADSVIGIFDRFAATSSVAASAQQETAYQLKLLEQALEDGRIGATEFAAEFAAIQDAAKGAAKDFDDAAKIMAKYGESTKDTTAEQERLADFLDRGLIGLREYNAAMMELTGVNEEIAASERERSQMQDEANKILARNVEPINRYRQEAERLNQLREAGLLPEREYGLELERAKERYRNAEEAARNYGKAASDAGNGTKIAFNELSGVIGLLPGPIGAVSSRISSIASAGNGLQKVFSGGIRQAVGGLAEGLGGLFTKANLVVAGIAAVGAAATAIYNGLRNLEGQVKALGGAAAQLGVDFQTVQVLSEAADRAGTSIQSVASQMQKFAVRLDEARQGSGQAAAAFAELGISQEELAASSPTEIAARVSEELDKIEDPARRAALQVATLGKSGAELKKVFSEIPEAAADLERFGGAISDSDRERVEALGPAFDGMGVAMRALGQSAILPFAGLVEGLVKTLSGLINVVTGVVQALGAVLGPALDAIGSAFAAFGDAVNGAMGFLRGFFGTTEEATASAADMAAAATELTDLDDGPSKEFLKTLDNIDGALNKAINESAEFGQAGFDAAQRYQESINQLQAQFDKGILNETAFAQAAARAEAEYRKQIETIKEAAAETERKAKKEQEAAERAREAIDKAIKDADRALLRDQQYGGSEERIKAAETLVVINQEILRVEQEIAAARAAGDQAAADAGAQRLAKLDQLKAREEDIASGEAERREKAAKEQEKKDKERAKKLEDINQKLAEKQDELMQESMERDSKRWRELEQVRGGAVKVGDLRSTEGASAFLNLAAGKLDPAVEEYRKQLKELKEMRKDLQKLETQKAEILAGEAA